MHLAGCHCLPGQPNAFFFSPFIDFSSQSLWSPWKSSGQMPGTTCLPLVTRYTSFMQMPALLHYVLQVKCFLLFRKSLSSGPWCSAALGTMMDRNKAQETRASTCPLCSLPSLTPHWHAHLTILKEPGTQWGSIVCALPCILPDTVYSLIDTILCGSLFFLYPLAQHLNHTA